MDSYRKEGIQSYFSRKVDHNLPIKRNTFRETAFKQSACNLPSIGDRNIPSDYLSTKTSSFAMSSTKGGKSEEEVVKELRRKIAVHQNIRALAESELVR